MTSWLRSGWFNYVAITLNNGEIRRKNLQQVQTRRASGKDKIENKAKACSITQWRLFSVAEKALFVFDSLSEFMDLLGQIAASAATLMGFLEDFGSFLQKEEERNSPYS